MDLIIAKVRHGVTWAGRILYTSHLNEFQVSFLGKSILLWNSEQARERVIFGEGGTANNDTKKFKKIQEIQESLEYFPKYKKIQVINCPKFSNDHQLQSPLSCVGAINMGANGTPIETPPTHHHIPVHSYRY